MRILFISRHRDMGYSIAKVFRPIIYHISQKNDTSYIEMPAPSYKPLQIIRNIYFVRKEINKFNPDIIHIIGSEHYLLPFISKKKSIITVHDIGFFTNENRLLKKIWKYIMFILPLNLAKIKVFISEKSKNECSTYLINRNNLKVIPDCVEDNYMYKDNIILNKPKILQIGTKQNKNITRVIQAIKGLNIHYRIIGKLDENTLKQLESNKIDFSNAYNLTDEEILNEYYNCNIVSFPSLYEGFGMPIIEGQATGRIVVTSDLPPMNQIANQDSAILVNPYDINSIKEGFIKAMNISQTMIEAGLANAYKYSAKNVSLQYIDLYKSLYL